jgi:ketose-bisphosphate aldolase
MATSVRSVFESARRDGWAIGAFNVSNLEEVKAVMQAAKKLEAPVLIEASPGEVDYFGMRTLQVAVDEYREEHQVHAWLNLDHAVDQKRVEAAISVGFDLVHFDGSLLERADNIAHLKNLVPKAHHKGLLIEGEPDHITGSSTAHTDSLKELQEQSSYSDPEQFKAFVEQTKIDTAAVFVGNVHGLYEQPKRLNLGLLKELRLAVSCYLSLHGGSGIPDEDIKAAIAIGVTKINVNSELRQAFADGLRTAVRKPKELAPYKYLPEAVSVVQAVVEQKIKLFGSAGKSKQHWVKRTII